MLLNLVWRSKRKYIKIDKAKESKIVSTRTTRPAHFLFKIESFTKLVEILSKTSTEGNYESPEFECGGHKWKLSLYPNGNAKMGGNGHISLYLVTADAGIDSLGSVDILAMFKLFVFDQKRDRYLTIQDGEVRKFHSMKKEWGFTRMVSIKEFINVKKGYLVNDCCIFGAEILVIPPAVKSASFSVIEEPREGNIIWKINNFSTLNGTTRFSRPFSVLGNQWKLALRLVNDRRMGELVCLYLVPHEVHEPNIYVECVLEFKGKIGVRLFCLPLKDHGWFCEDDGSTCLWTYQTMFNLQQESNDYIVDDTLTVEATINAISKIVTTESEY